MTKVVASKERVNPLYSGKLINLNLKVPISTKVACLSHLLKCLRSFYDKQCGPRSDCSYRSTLFASILKFISNFRQLFVADDFSRCHFSDAFFLGTLRVKYFYKQ